MRFALILTIFLFIQTIGISQPIGNALPNEPSQLNDQQLGCLRYPAFWLQLQRRAWLKAALLLATECPSRYAASAES